MIGMDIHKAENFGSEALVDLVIDFEFISLGSSFIFTDETVQFRIVESQWTSG
jgi:hypothetical protein